MLELKETWFFGYSKSSVHYKVDSLNKDIFDLSNQVQSQEEMITELRKSLKTYQEQESFISDALTEAKKLSATIIKEAQDRAKGILDVAREDVARRLHQAEVSFHDLEQTRQVLVEHEEFMRIELKMLLEKHRKMLENIDFQVFQAANEKANQFYLEGGDRINSIQEDFDRVDQASHPEPEPVGEKAVKPEDDVPVFTLEDMAG